MQGEAPSSILGGGFLFYNRKTSNNSEVYQTRSKSLLKMASLVHEKENASAISNKLNLTRTKCIRQNVVWNYGLLVNNSPSRKTSAPVALGMTSVWTVTIEVQQSSAFREILTFQ